MLKDVFDAVQAGKELRNAVTWKKAQLLSGPLLALLLALKNIAAENGYVIPLDETQINYIVTAIVALWGLFVSYTTVATTSRFGLSGGAGTPPADGDSGGDHYGLSQLGNNSNTG